MLDDVTLNQDGTITYHNEGDPLTWHTEDMTGDTSVPMHSSGNYSITLPSLAGGLIGGNTVTGSWSLDGSTEGGVTA